MADVSISFWQDPKYGNQDMVRLTMVRDYPSYFIC